MGKELSDAEIEENLVCEWPSEIEPDEQNFALVIEEHQRRLETGQPGFVEVDEVREIIRLAKR